MIAASFYDSVMRELVFALGAALFVANALALYRRKSDADAAVQRTVAQESRPAARCAGTAAPMHRSTFRKRHSRAPSPT